MSSPDGKKVVYQSCPVGEAATIADTLLSLLLLLSLSLLSLLLLLSSPELTPETSLPAVAKKLLHGDTES